MVRVVPPTLITSLNGHRRSLVPMLRTSYPHRLKCHGKSEPCSHSNLMGSVSGSETTAPAHSLMVVFNSCQRSRVAFVIGGGLAKGLIHG